MTYHDEEDDDYADDDYAGASGRKGVGDDDRELPDVSDMDDPADEDVAETVPCPHCRRPVYESAERCPNCGRYLSAEDAPSRHPRWVLAGVVVCLVIIVLVWVLGR
jgi:hypothetical protein